MGLFRRKDALRTRMESVHGEMHRLVQREGDMGAQRYSVFDEELEVIYAIQERYLRDEDLLLYELYGKEGTCLASMIETKEGGSAISGEKLVQNYQVIIGEQKPIRLHTSWQGAHHRCQMDYKGWYLKDRGLGYYINGTDGPTVRIAQKVMPLRYILDILEPEDELYAIFMILAVILTGNRYRQEEGR